jgi:hypothetical protein
VFTVNKSKAEKHRFVLPQVYNLHFLHSSLFEIMVCHKKILLTKFFFNIVIKKAEHDEDFEFIEKVAQKKQKVRD